MTGLLQVTDARSVWDEIKGPLAECMAGADDRVEDVYAGLIDGRYTLLTADDAIAVVTILPIANRGAKELLVVCAHSRGGEGGALKRYQNQIDVFARRAGAVRVRIVTRHEWMPRALPPGWALSMCEYVRTL